MMLNEYGKTAEKYWHWLGKQYPYMILHSLMVMPNHIHGIIEINRSRIVGTGHRFKPWSHFPPRGNLKCLKKHTKSYVVCFEIRK